MRIQVNYYYNCGVYELFTIVLVIVTIVPMMCVQTNHYCTCDVYELVNIVRVMCV